MKLIQKMLAVSALAGVFCSSALATPVVSFGNVGGDLAQSYNLGDTVSLDVWISGLEATDLGGFDMNFSFNGAVTGFQDAVFSSDLDDSLFYGLSAAPTSSNSLNLFGFSLLADLSAQADALKLFTLTFTAGEVGTSTLKLDDFLLSDAMGLGFASESYLAEITVNGQPASVPEPGTLGLMLGALALVWGRRRLV